MAISQAVLATVFGILGNIISFFVCLAPIPTFVRIYKRKSSEGYQSIPYVISLFSAMLWMYYAMIKKDAMMLITINSFAFVIQIVYISLYFFYAPKKEKTLTVKFVLFVDVFGFGAIFVLTYFLIHANKRVHVLGYICMVFALSVFLAPLGIIRKVIKTKSAEFMPFGLSFFLTLSAVMWFFYGLLLKDMNIALPNVLGFIFGVLQMILFLIYKKPGTKVLEPPGIKLQDISEHVVDVVRLSTMVCNSQMRTLVPQDSADMEATIDIDEKIKGDIEKIKDDNEAFLISKN
ncbi:nodulin MtN3 family protein [Arabidopsis lyrata subsp. lyrata]|uniref:Bidirectional sugar transporter SWEET n=1 Tax=Arabidopsis lyrata subsp. lyrata TaxID=81972 RepID=D7MQB1_ARALL|nr:bidirectional sugar transporter SWEET10 [Arabidopsis lyrata subsp. lyrata]EFH42082.1 nodulin MtN3 family protein [Arabidopsis lyrata subsp. lyrata]|eukprot:XP_002865823.1 bidirectional sugar transporter SWEET10 [Arabidopsis lyrata subsp. lyrata]